MERKEIREGLKTLQINLALIQNRLRMTKSKAKRSRLKEELDCLKTELGWKLLDMGEYKKGLAIYSSIQSKRHTEIKINGMSRALIEMGFFDEANRLLKRGLKTYPRSYALWTGMGSYYSKVGKDLQCLRCFEMALRLAPAGDPTALFNKAQMLTKLGKHKLAMEILEELVRRDPYDVPYLILLGYCQSQMGCDESALRLYQRALELWQKNPTAYEGVHIYGGLYSTYRSLEMLGDALKTATEGLELLPNADAVLYHNLADAYCALGWKNDAVRILNDGIKRFPNDEQLETFLMEIEEDPDDDDGSPFLKLMLLAMFIKAMKGRRPRR